MRPLTVFQGPSVLKIPLYRKNQSDNQRYLFLYSQPVNK